MDNCHKSCSDCNYAKAKAYRRKGTTNMRMFFCGHPNQAFIVRAFVSKGYKGQVGYIGMGSAHSDKPDVKSSPPWCPLRDGRNRR